MPNPAAPDSVGRQVTIKKIDGQPNVVTITAESVSGPDGSAVGLRKFNDYVSILSNGAAWHEVSGRYDTPVMGWANPEGSGFNRGVFNSDEISNVGFTYDRDVLNAINYRLLGTRDVLRALILDLKSRGGWGIIGTWMAPSMRLTHAGGAGNRSVVEICTSLRNQRQIE